MSAFMIASASFSVFAVSGVAQSEATKVERPVLASLLALPADGPSGSTTKDSTNKESATKDSTTKDSAVSPAAKNPDSSNGSPAVPPALAATPVPIKADMIVKELAEMKARIAQLEAELKESKDGEDSKAADKDANALRAAEADSVAAAGSSSSTAGIQDAATPATPATPEISAQTTTKGEPFPGDWTWLNSNGHASDSPIDLPPESACWLIRI